jgi:hypothetical protein
MLKSWGSGFGFSSNCFLDTVNVRVFIGPICPSMCVGSPKFAWTGGSCIKLLTLSHLLSELLTIKTTKVLEISILGGEEGGKLENVNMGCSGPSALII